MWSSNVDSEWNTNPGFVKARPHYSQHCPCSAILIGGIVAFGSPRPLAKDCRLIMARRRWHLLKFLTNVCEWKASCFSNDEWCETFILSPSSIRPSYAEGESFSSLLLANTVKKLQRPLTHESESEEASVAPHRRINNFSLILTLVFFFFFFFNFSQKLHGRVTRNVEKKST